MEQLDPKTIKRFFCKIEKKDNCWIWTATKTSHGYGQFGLNYKIVLAHRVCYEMFKGIIPDDMELDHICRNTSCVNPDHLEAVSHQENCIRGNCGKNNQNAKKMYCVNNHPLIQENLVKRKDGRRECLICHRTQWKSWKRRQMRIEK